MAHSIIKNDAEDLLRSFLGKQSHIEDKIAQNIDLVLRGSHKTYRYILVTALLAKACDETIDALSLQAGDESDGAYDARSLCHQVLVPFERECVPNSMGNSNEPYLNKPARFPRLTLHNAVRRGNDKKTLELAIDILSQIKTKEEAKRYLGSAVYTLQVLSRQYDDKFNINQSIIGNFTVVQNILDLSYKILKQNCEGESSALVVSAIEQIASPELTVVPHKVNESGSSSKEVGDIDVYNSDEIVRSIEVKDKNFSKEDVEHAISKFISAGITSSMFLYGKDVSFDKDSVEQVAARFGRSGFYCAVLSVKEYVKLRLAYVNKSVETEAFVGIIMNFAKQIEAKDVTIAWIRNCAEND